MNISATTGRHVDRLVPAIETALAGWETRVPTGRLNTWLTGLIAATPPPVRGGRQPKVLFATQAGIRPPHVVLFTTGFLEAAYRRFVERKLREEFGFEGSPLKVSHAAAGKARPRLIVPGPEQPAADSAVLARGATPRNPRCSVLARATPAEPPAALCWPGGTTQCPRSNGQT